MDGREAIPEGLAPVSGVNPTGTWHLTGCVLTYANSKFQRSWESSVSGYMIYAPNGHICKSLDNPGRDSPMEGICYCSRSDVVEDCVVLDITVSDDVSLVGSALLRNVDLVKDPLVRNRTPAPEDDPGSVPSNISTRTMPIALSINQHPVGTTEMSS